MDNDLDLVEKAVLEYLSENGYTDSYTLSTELQKLGKSVYPQVYAAINHLVIVGLICTFIDPNNRTSPCEYRIRLNYENSCVHESKLSATN